MDLKQTDHLKSYGIAYWILERNVNVEWLLNYRGGSFLFPQSSIFESECRLRGIYYETISSVQVNSIYATIEENNMEKVLLEKAPKIAVYTPPNSQPWDDAVTLALNYSEITYEQIYDTKVLAGFLSKYDWLHLHHEDFTGQYGKFWASFKNEPWYIEQQIQSEELAKNLGFQKVTQLKGAVAREIPFDYDPVDPDYETKLDFLKTLAFKDFRLYTNPNIYEFSDIDTPPSHMPRLRDADTDYFTLFEFSAKYDPVPTMLTQNHVNVVKGFMGQTTMFREEKIKPSLVIMGKIVTRLNIFMGIAGRVHLHFMVDMIRKTIRIR
jgi:hypothetical protein